MKKKRLTTAESGLNKGFYLTVVCCALMGAALFFLLFGGGVLNPTETRWVRFGGGDNFQHYIGWRFYRNAPWIRYLTFYRNLNYPIGSTTVATDSNPLAAMIFKVFRWALPKTFQYNGIWLLLSFALSGFFAGCIGYRLTGRSWGAFLFTGFALSNPVPIQRALIHDSLAGHWLILAAIWLALNRRDRRTIYAWFGLIFAALGIHVYFLPMLLFILTLELIVLIGERASWRYVCGLAIGCAGAVGLGYVFFGYDLIDAGTASFGELSLNLNAFFNPDGASRILPARPTFPLQYEGFNYWGLGVLLLAVLSLAFTEFSAFRRWVPLLVPTLGLILFAASNRIAFDRTVLVDIRLPARLESVFSIFRSSGRLVWPLFYLCLIWVFRALAGREDGASAGRRRAMAGWILLTAAFALQLYDLSGFYRSVSDRVCQVMTSEAPERIDAAAWTEVLSAADSLELTDGPAELKDAFAMLAADLGLTINKGSAARGVRPVAGGDLVPVETRLESGEFVEGAVYVLLNEAARELALQRYPEAYRAIGEIGYLDFNE